MNAKTLNALEKLQKALFDVVGEWEHDDTAQGNFEEWDNKEQGGWRLPSLDDAFFEVRAFIEWLEENGKV